MSARERDNTENSERSYRREEEWKKREVHFSISVD